MPYLSTMLKEGLGEMLVTPCQSTWNGKDDCFHPWPPDLGNIIYDRGYKLYTLNVISIIKSHLNENLAYLSFFLYYLETFCWILYETLL